MFPANAYVIRPATNDDQAVLERLAGLDSQRTLSGRALIGEIDGVPAAAISVADGRIVADPFKLTDHLVPVLMMRRRSLLAFAERPSLPARLKAGMAQLKPAAS
jgi:hypothetical protein